MEPRELANVLAQDFDKDWATYHGDTVEILPNLPDECIHLSVFSPPFMALYTYTPTERDLGNSQRADDFMQHFDYVIKELLRVTISGRCAAVHIADVTATMLHDGYMGLKDFSGDVIEHFVKHGWTFHSRVPIDKNQQAQAIRTHALSLTMTQMEKDRTRIYPALPDYILKFRKPGENLVPVAGGMTGDEWIEFANPTWSERETSDFVRERLSAIRRTLLMANGECLTPTLDFNERICKDVELALAQVTDFQEQIERWLHKEYPESEDRCADTGAHATWYGILATDTLQGWQGARTEKDELHVCPLQLGTIERCIRLWSNPDEIVLDPFMGIGSTGYKALQLGRKFIGAELKNSYYRMAVENLKHGARQRDQQDLFAFAGVEVENA